MNLTNANAKNEETLVRSRPKTHLRVLSKIQRGKVMVIAKEWQKFTSEVYSQMFDKI
ncbi:MAG: hypothetical protein AAFP76_04350 [Bacteroidota bacterium]